MWITVPSARQILYVNVTVYEDELFESGENTEDVPTVIDSPGAIRFEDTLLVIDEPSSLPLILTAVT